MTSKIGRPPLVNARRNHVSVRFNTAELAHLHNAATACGMTLSRYIRCTSSTMAKENTRSTVRMAPPKELLEQCRTISMSPEELRAMLDDVQHDERERCAQAAFEWLDSGGSPNPAAVRLAILAGVR